MILDSCILIDLTRHHGSATSFVTGLSEPPRISVISITELRAGQRGERDSRIIDRIVGHSLVLDVNEAIAEIAGKWMRQFRKSHGLDIADALIAATAIHHELQLATLNLKHFPMFPDLGRPY